MNIEIGKMADLSLNEINSIEVKVWDIVENIAIVGNPNFPKESFPVDLSRLKPIEEVLS